MVKIPHDFSIPESCTDLVDELAHTVYAHGNDNQKGQAMLCTVYFRCVRCWRMLLVGVVFAWVNVNCGHVGVNPGTAHVAACV